MVPRRLLFLTLLLLAFAATASAEVYEHPYPEALQMSVEAETRQTDAGTEQTLRVPITNNATVNQNLRDAVEALYAQVLPYAGCRLDMMATYRISGTKWAGFLLTGRAVLLSESDEDTYTSETTEALFYDVQTYDMETGEALTLADVFSKSSEAWPLIEAAARELLNSYYPDEVRDADALEAMLTQEALERCAFLPGAGRLLVPFSLETILPEHKQIVYLTLAYPDYRPLMLEEAAEQTDNSTRPIICLTFDDGPNRVYTQQVLEGLADYGASATFFCIGRSVSMQPDLLRREMDYMNTVAAHSMTHVNPWEQSKADMVAEYDAQKTLYQAVTGIPVSLLRPPGGDLKTYVSRQIGWPLIKWNKSGSDTSTSACKSTDIAVRVEDSAEHGDIFLMHDTKENTAAAVPLFLAELQERGFMFATVDELLYLNGVTPQPNVAYYDALGEKTYSKD